MKLRYAPFTNQLKASLGYQMLQRARVAFARSKTKYWLDFGTLLGCTRERAFIAHDYDIDVSMHAEDWSDDIHKSLEANGLKFLSEHYPTNEMLEKYVKEDKDKPTERIYSYKGIQLDIWMHHKSEGVGFDGPSRICFGWHGTDPFEMPAEMTQSFVTARFPEGNSGVDYPVPVNAEAYLEQMYGATWREPLVWCMSVEDRSFLVGSKMEAKKRGLGTFEYNNRISVYGKDKP